MTDAGERVLLIGYGNPGRRDDGLGPVLAEAVSRLGIDGVTVDVDYQLNVEDAAAVAEHDVVIFADADTTSEEPFYFARLEPAADMSFSTHSVRPEAVLGLALRLFGSAARGYVLGIRGYEFNTFGEDLSPRARQNLDEAAAFVEDVLRRRAFDEAVTRRGSGSLPAGASIT